MASIKVTNFDHLQIPLKDVLEATNNFHRDNIIGHGGFGPAYKGRLLRSGKLMKIAVLRLDRKYGEGDVEFWTEITVLSDLKHPNLVSIIGFCDEKDEKIIVTTYEANGSLKEHLNSPNLTWTQRLKICVGIARALSYLHFDEGRGYGVIHLNINSSSILVDKDWEAKLSGFKVSIKQPINRMDQVVLSEPIGTIGYMDPTIEKTRGVTHKSDIYSFGVVLFEILCGREAYVKNEANRFLARLAKDHYENKTLQDIIHPNLWNQVSLLSFAKYSKLAYSCLKEDRAQRPDRNNIVKKLEKALQLQLRRENLEQKLEHLKIPLLDIKLATDNFSETYKLSTLRSFMYRAELKLFDKENHSSVEGKNKGEHSKRCDTVVIKKYPFGHEWYGEEQFFTELEVLTIVKHPNIVTLLGFCVEDSEMILVTKNFSNGYLFSYLKNINGMLHILTWEKRLKICIDVAHALNYLHSEMEDKKMIISCDINSFNIALDDNLGATIVDFWYSKFLPPDQEDKVLYLKDFFCRSFYLDPECKRTWKLKRESDVYSFGVVLFEILSGMLAFDPIYLKESDKGLAFVARQSYCTGTLEDLIDPIIKKEIKDRNDSLNTFVEIAYQCVTETQDQRPTMKVVVKELEKALLLLQERTQCANSDNVVNKLEKLQLTPEILEERIQHPNTNKVVDRLDKLQLTIHGKKLEQLKIPLTDIQLATDDFSDTHTIASMDGFTLYRAELNHFDKEHPSSVDGKNNYEYPNKCSTVLIKRYPNGRHDVYGKEEYFTELEVLTSVMHRNIVALLGFCAEGSEMILVIENFSNGYLHDYLGDANKMRILTWEKRLKICIDVAQALNYLHYELEDQKIIINRDICMYNIGLDEKLGAKIVNFCFSIFMPQNQEDEALYVKWTGRPFNIDPEYKMTRKLKRESDIYSFGVVLFEILCGRPSYDSIYLNESKEGLPHVARQNFYKGTLEEKIDPIIKEETGENSFLLNRGPNKDSLRTFTEIAYQCVAKAQDQRPTMKVVVKELEKALLFQKNNKNNPRISLEDITHATQNFHNDNFIGGGGFGRVFKGTLQDGDGFKIIVAKRLDKRSDQGEKEFLTELQILLENKHENVIGLLGYCDEKDEKIIVYEYAPRGNLHSYLNNASLTWVKRLNICIDVANALYFLHGEVRKQAKVIHRDIKTANILLTDDWKAKLADFGLSLISPLIEQGDYVIDHVCGTPGYLDPVYHKLGFLTIESDIYSFGVVLFEILCGRSTFAIHKQDGHYLPDFIKNKFEEGKHDEVVFEPIREEIVPESMTIFQDIAYQCLHHEREKRPTTRKLLSQLNKALRFQNMASIITKCAPLRIPLEDILKATNNFNRDNIIGGTGFGPSYKGLLLRSGDLIITDARRLDRRQGVGDLEFWTEVTMLYELKHTNIVSIIGFCDEKDEKIIITKYMVNGSLKQYLNRKSFTWTERLRVSIGVARALSYLHYDEGRDYAIIHRIINSQTILLDENFEAKLAYFEHSIKQFYEAQTHLCEPIVVWGYVDPSILTTGGVTCKSDTYSFGVVLFEILCGREAYVENDDISTMVPLFQYHYEAGTLEEIILPDLWNQISPKSLLIYSKVAYSCIEEDPANRPDMDYVVDELEKALELS